MIGAPYEPCHPHMNLANGNKPTPIPLHRSTSFSVNMVIYHGPKVFATYKPGQIQLFTYLLD